MLILNLFIFIYIIFSPTLLIIFNYFYAYTYLYLNSLYLNFVYSFAHFSSYPIFLVIYFMVLFLIFCHHFSVTHTFLVGRPAPPHWCVF